MTISKLEGVLIILIQHRCNICTAEFESKTKLFKHIRDLGHAASTVQPGGTGNGRKV